MVCKEISGHVSDVLQNDFSQLSGTFHHGEIEKEITIKSE